MKESDWRQTTLNLHEQITSLHQTIEALPEQIRLALTPVLERKVWQDAVARPSHREGEETIDDLQTMGTEILSPSSTEKEIPLDIQVQRLNAHITVAYNRIAELEEQLLFRHRS